MRSSTSGIGWPCRTRASRPCVVVQRLVLRPWARDRGHRRGLGHPPGVQDRHARRPVRLRQRPGHGRPAAEDPLHRRQVVVLQQGQRAQPDRRHARGDGDPVALQQPEYTLRGHVRAGEHHARPGQQPGVRQAPGVDVEHRHHRHEHVALREAQPVRRQRDQRVQQRRPVAVDHALRVAGGAGGVAHRRGAVLVVDLEPCRRTARPTRAARRSRSRRRGSGSRCRRRSR